MTESEANTPDSIPNLVATCQQTRFHIAEDRHTSEVRLDDSAVTRLAIPKLTCTAPPGLGGEAYRLYTPYSK